MNVARSPETAANHLRVASKARHTSLCGGPLPKSYRRRPWRPRPHLNALLRECIGQGALQSPLPGDRRVSPQYAPTGLRMARNVLQRMTRSPVSDQFST